MDVERLSYSNLYLTFAAVEPGTRGRQHMDIQADWLAGL